MNKKRGAIKYKKKIFKLSRNKTGQTDYGKRIKLLRGCRQSLTVKPGVNNYTISVVEYDVTTCVDEVITSFKTGYLLNKINYSGSGTSRLGLYLAGYVFGRLFTEKTDNAKHSSWILINVEIRNSTEICKIYSANQTYIVKL